jgi:DHA1 family multidrug resistance protein-like MFS transporter
MGAVGGCAYFLTAIGFGHTAERWNRRGLLVVASAVQSVVAFAFSAVTNLHLLVLLSGVQSLAAGWFWPSVEGLVVEDVESVGVDASVSGFNISWSVGWIVGPLIGGYVIELFSPRAAFWVGSVIPLCNALVFLTVRPPRNDDARAKAPVAVTLGAASILKRLNAAYLAAFLYAFSSRIVGSLFPALASDLRITALSLGVILQFFGLARTLLFTQTLRIARSLSKRRLLTLGSLLIAVSAALIAFGATALHFGVAMVFLGLGAGASYFGAITVVLNDVDVTRGLRSGWFEGMIGLGSVTGPFLGGLSYQISPRGPYVLILALTLGFVLYNTVRRPGRPRRKT